MYRRLVRRRALAAGGTCLAYCLAPAWASAGEHGRLELFRDPAASSCPDEKGLSDAVAARLGYEPFQIDAPVAVRVRFTHGTDGWHGTVELRGARGEERGARTLSSDGTDCNELAEAAALTISILLDPRSGLGPRPVRPASPPTPAEVPDLAPPGEPTAVALMTEPPKPPRRPLFDRFAVSAHFTGSANLLPAVTWGVKAGAEVHRGPWSLGLEGRFDAPVTHAIGAHEVTASFGAVELAPCVHWSIGRACLPILLGGLAARVDQTPSQTAFMLLVGPRLGATVKLTSWLALDASADLLVAPVGVALGSPTERGTIWSTPELSGLLGIGALGWIP